MQRPAGASQEGWGRSGQGGDRSHTGIAARPEKGSRWAPEAVIAGACLLLSEAPDSYPPSCPSPALTQVSHPLSSSLAPGTGREVHGVQSSRTQPCSLRGLDTAQGTGGGCRRRAQPPVPASAWPMASSDTRASARWSPSREMRAWGLTLSRHGCGA